MALVSMGVYVFKKTVLLGALRAHCDSGSGCDFGHNIVPSMIHSARVFAYDFRDKTLQTPHYWRDVGTIDSYYNASMDLVQVDDQRRSQPARDPSMNNRRETRANPPRINSNSEVIRTVLSPGVRIESGAKVHESVLMPGVVIGKGARLHRTIVEEGVRVPAGYRAGFDLHRDRELHTVTRSGVVVISRNPARTRPAVLNFALSGSRKRTARRTEYADAVRLHA
jgi:glucose-1-phosphate adenylyltransferase